MDVRNCRNCGKLFNYLSGPHICPACREALEEKFKEVKKYIQDHKGVTIHEVSEACEVDPQQIRQWIREERLEFADGGVTGISCEKCGTPIPTGRFCEKCKAEMSNNLNSVMTKKKTEPAKVKKDPRDNPKMRFL